LSEIGIILTAGSTGFLIGFVVFASVEKWRKKKGIVD
jgi:hypothetical protein